MKIVSKTKGAVSIFLVIILVPMMMVSSLFIDAGKVKLSNGVIESAGDLSMNTALTDYDTKLKDLYGLMATAQDTEELYEKLEDYYRSCITSSGVGTEDADNFVDMIMAQLRLTAEDDNTADILNMELLDFDVSKREDATLCNPVVMEKEIVEFMKYRAPINTGLSFISALKSFSTLSEQTNLVDKRQEYYKEQGSIMQEAKSAWDDIANYEKAPFAKDYKYLTDMETNFKGYKQQYYDISKKIIKDLYDAQSYVGFSPRFYHVEGRDVEIKGSTKNIPFFFTDEKKTSYMTPYNELNTYSDSRKATANNIKTALTEYYTAYRVYKTALEQLMEFNSNTYGQQFLVQTNRRKLYETWTDSMKKLYEKYSMLRHAATYSGETSDGKSVMETEGKLFGETEQHPYSYYYSMCTGGSGGVTSSYSFNTVANEFNNKIEIYNEKLKEYSNAANADISETENKIVGIYTQLQNYKSTIESAIISLDGAIGHLEKIYGKVEPGGELDQRKKEWKAVAESDKLKDNTMARQDKSEIEDLSMNLDPDKVNELKVRLSNIKDNLGKVLEEMNSYKFFGTNISDISNYQSLVNILKNKIGDGALKTVPTDKDELEEWVSNKLNNQFVIGKKVVTSWCDDSGTQTKLAAEKLNFYSYLASRFKDSEVEEDKDNGQNLYDKVKDNSADDAKKDAEEKKDSGITTGKEINKIDNNPSKSSSGGGGAAGADKVETSDLGKTSKSLSSMFGNLAKNVLNMGEDLRDKLYVSDYIMNMFSYDTIEAEFKVEHKDEELKLETLTKNPIDKDHNYAYGREVEYIIYGGSNASNVTKSYASIFGIRFAFNLIYAFMDSGIRDTAGAIAAPISAATMGVLPVPLVQAVIIIADACCESALDLLSIKNGEAVPLFKDKDSWQCSLSGIISKGSEAVGGALKEVLKDGAELVIDEATKEMNKYLDMTDEELSEVIKNKTKDITKTVGDSYDALVTRHISTVIQKFTTLCNNAIEESFLTPGLDTAKYVEERLDSWLEEEAKTDGRSNVKYTIKEKAVNYIKNNCIDSMIECLSSKVQKGKQFVAENTKKINEVIEKIRENITKEVNKAGGAIDEYKSKMINEVKDSMNKGSKELKETLNSKLDGVFGSGGTGTSEDNTGMASLLDFSYSDYMRLFLMIGLYTNESGVLMRTADVIQANMNLEYNKPEGTFKNSKYALSNSAVYVEISAKIQVKPTMLALPLFADVENNPSTNTNWYTINYKTIAGY